MPTSPWGGVTLIFPFLIFIASTTSGFKFPPTSLRIILSYILLLVLSLINSFYYSDLEELKYSFLLIEAILLFLALNNLFLTLPLKKLLKNLYISFGIIFFAFLLSAFGIYSFGYESNVGRNFGIISFNILKTTGIPMSDGRLGSFLNLMFFINFIYGNEIFENKKIRYVFNFLILLFIFLTQSRSTWLATALGLSMYIVFCKRYYILGILVAFTSLLTNSIISNLFTSFKGESTYSSNVDVRFEMISQIIKVVDNPFIGLSHNNVFFTVGDINAVIHNYFVDIILSYGLFTTIFIYNVYIYILFKLVKNSFKSKTVSLNSVILTSFTAVNTELFFYRGFYNEIVIIIFALFVYVNEKKSNTF